MYINISHHYADATSPLLLLLARHIRTAKEKEANKVERLRLHSDLFVQPRGRILRQEQLVLRPQEIRVTIPCWLPFLS
jgi:hypothetical protein